ncbi:hypothetical protein [Sulfuricurvum sp.]|uniref:hypothetical protein n=1 Tax=Sulfuricurvum sp. TaxID=2025608 RepID=UPI003BB6FB02
MKRVKYIFIFAILLLILKAFFLDDYLEKRQNENTVTTSNTVTTEHGDMPMEQFGDNIADSLND